MIFTLFLITALAFRKNKHRERIKNPRYPPIVRISPQTTLRFYNIVFFVLQPQANFQVLNEALSRPPESDRKLLERKSKVNGHEREKKPLFSILLSWWKKDIELSLSQYRDHAPAFMNSEHRSLIHSSVALLLLLLWCPFHSDANL